MDFSKKSVKENPHRGANVLSKLFLFWTVPLLWKGMQNGLTTKDLTKCLQKYKSKPLGDELEKEWKLELKRAAKNQRKPRLWRALIRVNFWEFVFYGSCRFFDLILRTSLPAVLGRLLVQFEKLTSLKTLDGNRTNVVDSNELHIDDKLLNNIAVNTSSMSLQCVGGSADDPWNNAFFLGTILVSMTLISNLIIHHSMLNLILMGTKKRIACCSLIYRKSIRLSASAACQTGTGHIVNLISNDVARIEKCMHLIHFIWMFPIQSVIIGYLTWQQVGLVGVIGVAFLFLQTVPLQTYLVGHYKLLLRKRVTSLTDKRIGIANEIVQGIQVIKMYAWEIPFQKVIAEARRMEIKQIRLLRYVGGIGISTISFAARSTLFVSIVFFVVAGQKITADTVFPMMRLFQLMQLAAIYSFPTALFNTGEALISIKRIEDFLLKEEDTDVKKPNSNTALKNIENAVELGNVSANWKKNSNINTLNEINLKIKAGQLCAVVGPVGGGKVRHTRYYCETEFPLPNVKTRFLLVPLQSSLIQLLLGELPVKSGQVAVNGSISYAAQESWIFAGTVRNNILFGQNYDQKRYSEVVKCCALTNDFKQLPYGDRTFVGDRGASVSGGQRARISLARAMYKPASIYLLDDPLSAVDAHVGKHLFDNVIGPKSQIAKNATRILVTHQVHLLKEADVIVIVENGRITHRSTYAELSALDIDFAKLLQEHTTDENNNDEKLNDELLNPVGQVYEDNHSETENDDNAISNGVQYKQLKLRTESISKLSMASQEINIAQNKEEEQVKGSFSWKTFTYYFTIGSSRYQLCFLIFVLAFGQCVISGTDYFVKYFIDQESKRDSRVEGLLTQTEYLLIYGALIILLIFICIFQSIIFYWVCMRSSKALHDKMLGGIFNAPMRFFDSNPSGRILNRISTDMGTIDDIMPPTMIDALDTTISLYGMLVLIIIVNPTMIVTLSFAIALYVLIFKLYMRASQDLKRLEGICRSPLFSHFTATINGLTTIRSANIHRKLCREFDELQDVHSSVSYLSVASTETFGIFMDFVSTLFLTSVIYSFIFFYDNSVIGGVGLGITKSMTITGLAQYGMRRLTDAMQQMTSVERIVQYTELEPERSPSNISPADWPSSGNIGFHEMSLRYDPEGEPTLKNISLDIRSGSKIGVVGRTGAGKSSLIAALFRLTHIDGLIEMDGIDTETISLPSLRSKISIIPQNPVMFAGSLRRNLDPFEEYSDDVLWTALENVQMKDVISSTEGLSMPVMSNGSNFSVGQRQLLCLARAILRKNRILILDEATANVDPQTDQLIQKTIRQRFADCTVITIAHRLHTIVDSDRVLVMEAGKCVEFDTPFNLLSTEGSVFRGMIKALGDK